MLRDSLNALLKSRYMKCSPFLYVKTGLKKKRQPKINLV